MSDSFITGIITGLITGFLTSILGSVLYSKYRDAPWFEKKQFKVKLKKYVLEVKNQIKTKNPIFMSYFSLNDTLDFDKNYVPHKGSKLLSIGENTKIVPISMNLDEFLLSELISNKQIFYCIIGEFGTGKSSLLVHLYYEYVKKYYKKLNVVPVIISMASFKKASNNDIDLIEQILLFLQNEYGMKRYNVSILKNALREGQIILFIDGLDEYMRGSNRLPHELVQLKIIGGSKSKILVTSRPSAFRTSDEFQMFFKEIPSDLSTVSNMVGINVIEIDMLNNEQILKVLKKNTVSEERIQYIFSNNQILGLCKQHLLLKMVIKTLPNLNDDSKLTDIYKIYIGICIQNEKVLNASQIIELCENIALWMYQNHKNEIDLKQISTIFDSVYSYDFQPDNLLFLIRTQGESFRFMHRSFMEYFVAKGLVKAIQNNNLQNFKAIKEVVYHEEISHFAREMLTSEDFKVLYKLLSNNEPWVRFIGAHFLSRLSVPNISQTILQLLEEEQDFLVKREYYISLAFLGYTEKFHDFVNLLVKDKSVQQQNDQMIFDYFNSRINTLVGCAKRLRNNPYYPTREMIIEFMGRHGTMEHISIIRKFVNDSVESIRMSSLNSIAMIKSRHPRPKILRLIILDLDGVIINSIEYHIKAWSNAAQALGKDVRHGCTDVFGRNVTPLGAGVGTV